ncbi:unnamed protein product [Schistosoma turkestanicum]|nr:unnamed protein product [Schistosoma turkestanicum]
MGISRMKMTSVIAILTCAYVVQVLSIKSPAVDKHYAQKKSNRINGRREVEISFYNAVLQNQNPRRLITWNPLYEDYTSLPYKQLSNAFCQQIIHLTTSVINPGSNLVKCRHVIFSKINIHTEYVGVIIGVKANSSLKFMYRIEPNFSINSLISKIKNVYHQGNKQSFLSIFQLTVRVKIRKIIETQHIEKLRNDVKRKIQYHTNEMNSQNKTETLTPSIPMQQSTSTLPPTNVTEQSSSLDPQPTNQDLSSFRNRSSTCGSFQAEGRAVLNVSMIFVLLATSTLLMIGLIYGVSKTSCSFWKKNTSSY